jgi:hypothetical protein
LLSLSARRAEAFGRNSFAEAARAYDVMLSFDQQPQTRHHQFPLRAPGNLIKNISGLVYGAIFSNSSQYFALWGPNQYNLARAP